MANGKDTGAILLLSLLVALLGLIIIGTLTQLFSFSTRFSGSLKRYTIALEVARSAVDDFRRDVETAWESCRSGDFVGEWRTDEGWKVVDAICSPSGEFPDNGTEKELPETADKIVNNWHWKKTYIWGSSDYEARVEVIKVGLLDKNSSKGLERSLKFLIVEVVAYRNGTSERAWYSVVTLRILGER